MIPIVRRSDALARGASDAELQRYCTTAAWRRLRPGRFVDRAAFDALPPEVQHAVRAEAVWSGLSAPDAAVSHVSAAVLHGLPVWGVPLRRVHVTRDRPSGARSTRDRLRHAGKLSEHDTVVIDGVRVTGLVRTVADVVRTVPFEAAVCIADAAAREHGLDRDTLLAELNSAPTHPGNARARKVALFFDGRSESVGESRSRVHLHEHGFAPDLQRTITTADGEFIGRGDFLFEDQRIVGEFDGREKYGRLVPEGSTGPDVLWAEKRREDAITAAGYRVVRWTWSDLEDFGAVVQRLRRAARR